ncbi:PD40 domain-containing protein [bacterium]|nr:PD40 domain-containing protein [bacterium]
MKFITLFALAIGPFGISSCDWLGGDDHSDPGTQIPNTELFQPLHSGTASYYVRVSPDCKSLLLIPPFYDTIGSNGTLLLDLETYEKKSITTEYLGSADWSPDSRWIVYEGYSNVWKDIFKIKSNGDSITQLTFDGISALPIWSPNGKWIVYSHVMDPGKGVWLMRPDGTEKSWAFLAQGSSWHPDGDKIICERDFDGFPIYSVNQGRVVDTLKAVKYETNINPKYSPDGKRILFRNYLGTYVMDANGKNIRIIFRFPEDPSQDFDWLASWYSNDQIIYNHFRVTRYVQNNLGEYYEGYASLYIKRIN